MIYSRLAMLAAGAMLSACSQLVTRDESTSNELSEDYLNKDVRYTVQPGDRLSDIALEFTGEQSKWRKIAEYNGITNPRKLQQGAVLQIPADLIPGHEDKKAQQAATQPGANKDSRVARQSPEDGKQSGEVVSASLAVKRAVETPSNQTPKAKVVVTPVQTNREFDLNPIAGVTNDGAENEVGVQRFIKVIGTYYPKGIYAQPAAYSELIMRVTPGTTFALDRKIEDWYRVIIDEGTGYIRASDAEVINDNPENTAPVASNRG